MVDDLREGRLDHDVPRHGTLIRVKRQGGLRVSKDDVAAERAEALAARTARAEAAAAAPRRTQGEQVMATLDAPRIVSSRRDYVRFLHSGVATSRPGATSRCVRP